MTTHVTVTETSSQINKVLHCPSPLLSIILGAPLGEPLCWPSNAISAECNQPRANRAGHQTFMQVRWYLIPTSLTSLAASTVSWLSSDLGTEFGDEGSADHHARPCLGLEQTVWKQICGRKLRIWHSFVGIEFNVCSPYRRLDADRIRNLGDENFLLLIAILRYIRTE